MLKVMLNQKVKNIEHFLCPGTFLSTYDLSHLILTKTLWCSAIIISILEMKQLSLREFGLLKILYVAPGLPDSRAQPVTHDTRWLVQFPHFVQAS